MLKYRHGKEKVEKLRLRRSLGTPILFMLITVFASVACSQPFLNPMESKPTAYVLIGDVHSAPGIFERTAYATAQEAKSDYEKAGYNVMFISQANKQDVINAINDPNTKALWIIGHGMHEDNGTPTPWIQMYGPADQYIEPKDLKVCPNLKNIKQVTFHACNQDLKAWRDLFPNADFKSWKSAFYFPQAYWWQWWNKYDPATGNATASVPVVNPNYENKQLCYDNDTGMYYYDMTCLANDFHLNEPLKSQFGSQAVNFYAVDSSTGDKQVLFGANLTDGKIVSSDPNGTISPTFDVSVTNEALYQIFENPSTIWDFYSGGSLNITSYVPVSKDTLLNGMACLLFGEVELTITTTVGGTANPSPGTYTYAYGTTVYIAATAFYGYFFSYWSQDGSYMGNLNPILVTMDSSHVLSAVFTKAFTGGCPFLYVYDCQEYVNEGLLDIESTPGSDVGVNHTLSAQPTAANGTYRFQLVESPLTVSHIDQVALYAVLEDGTTLKLSLSSTWHSAQGNVLPQLLEDDGWRIDLLGARWTRNGESQSVQLAFSALAPNIRIEAFIFYIDGNSFCSPTG